MNSLLELQKALGELFKGYAEGKPCANKINIVVDVLDNFKIEYDSQVHVDRKQLEDFRSKFIKETNKYYDGATDDELKLLTSIDFDFNRFFDETFSAKSVKGSVEASKETVEK